MKIEMPNEWHYSKIIEVRVTDLNYGNHLANEKFLAFAQEARVGFLQKFGYSELDFGGVSLIQADAAITFKSEGHLADKVMVEVSAFKAGNSSFNIFYKFTNCTKGKLMAEVRTSLVCFDYETSKPVAIPEIVLSSGIFSETA